jgi:hypothetical protein
MPYAPSLVEYLQRQLRWLERSAHFFDQGDQDEAVRIAIILRTLFHSRGGTVSLIDQLGLGSTARVFSFAGLHELDENTTLADFLTQITFDGFAPFVEKHPEDRHVPTLHVDTWWNRVVQVFHPHRLSRRDLVLTAADRDGGAHVDVRLNDAYRASASAWMFSRDGAPPTEHGVQFAAIRTMATEVLLSPDITSVAAA